MAETIIDMSNSEHDVADDLMCFQAGVYQGNNDADPDEAAQVSFYQLDNNHPKYGFYSANCAAATP